VIAAEHMGVCCPRALCCRPHPHHGHSRVKVVDGEAHVLDVAALLAAVQDGLQVQVEVGHVGVLLYAWRAGQGGEVAVGEGGGGRALDNK